MNKKRLMELAGVQESVENLPAEHLMEELFAQFKNAHSLFPADLDQLHSQLHKNAGAYEGICKDIVSIISQMRKKGMI